MSLNIALNDPLLLNSQLCEGIDIDLERLEDGIEDQEIGFGEGDNPERDNTQYDTQSEFSEIPQFQVMGEHSFKVTWSNPNHVSEILITSPSIAWVN